MPAVTKARWNRSRPPLRKSDIGSDALEFREQTRAVLMRKGLRRSSPTGGRVGHMSVNENVTTVNVEMPAEAVKRMEERGLQKRKRKLRYTTHFQYDLPPLEVHFHMLLREACARRDAGILAASHGQQSSGCWTAVWDDDNSVYVYAPRTLSAEMREEFKSEASSGGGIPDLPPYELKRSEGLKLLDCYWDTFRHEGEVPGPRERWSSGSTLGWRVEDRKRFVG